MSESFSTPYSHKFSRGAPAGPDSGNGLDSEDTFPGGVSQEAEHGEGRPMDATTPYGDPTEDDDEHLDRYVADFFRAYNIGTTPRDDRAEEPNPDEDESTTKSTDQADSPISQTPADRDNVAKMAPETVSRPAAAKPSSRFPAKPAKPRPPSTPPETAEELREMRQLANSTARKAIKVHVFRQTVGALRLYLVVGIVCLVGSFALLDAASHAQSREYMFAVTASAAAAFSCLRFLQLSRKIGRAGARPRRARLSKA